MIPRPRGLRGQPLRTEAVLRVGQAKAESISAPWYQCSSSVRAMPTTSVVPVDGSSERERAAETEFGSQCNTAHRSLDMRRLHVFVRLAHAERLRRAAGVGHYGAILDGVLYGAVAVSEVDDPAGAEPGASEGGVRAHVARHVGLRMTPSLVERLQSVSHHVCTTPTPQASTVCHLPGANRRVLTAV